MPDTNGIGWRNVVITALLSMLLTGGGAWVAWGRQAVDKDDVALIVSADRQTIANLARAVDRLTEQVQTHGEQLAKFAAIVERLENRSTRIPGREP